ncbi:hypothetical protein FMM79_02070 [Novosphingobium sp. BW1]|nr:hypothetical protein FMM79_02070 [Novosphingobium sp. BW1]
MRRSSPPVDHWQGVGERPALRCKERHEFAAIDQLFARECTLFVESHRSGIGEALALAARHVLGIGEQAPRDRKRQQVVDRVSACALASPVWRLVQALQTLVTPDGNTAAIDGWFTNVRPLTAREKELIAFSAANTDETKVKAMMGGNHWIDDLPFEAAIARQASQPTVNIEGLVAGYTGPGGKTILPGRAAAKLDLRLVPNQSRAEAERKLRAHLDAHGFPDVEMKVTGGYDPTEVAENARLIRAQKDTYAAMGVKANLFPRLAGSWPGAVFTARPVSIPATQFGIGHGSGAHAPDEYFVIDSTNPKVAGMSRASLGFVELMYQLARTT